MPDPMGSLARSLLVTIHKLEEIMSDTAEDTIETVTAFNAGYKSAKEDADVAFAEIERLRLATDEGSLAKRADRMWEIARQMLGRPVAGARLFLG